MAKNGATASSDSRWAILHRPRPPLRLLVLGARTLVLDDRVVWPTPETADEACWELLFYLAVQDPAGVQATVLTEAFWPNGAADRSLLRKRRHRLRQILKELVPSLGGEPLPTDPQGRVYRLNPNVIECDLHRFILLVETAKMLPSEQAIRAYDEALGLYRGDLLDRPDVPTYRWFDQGPRPLARDLRVTYARMQRDARRRLADLLAAGTSDEWLMRAEELYVGLSQEDPLDNRLWEALFTLHGRRNDVLGLEATVRRLRMALAELEREGEGEDEPALPPALERRLGEVRRSLLNGEGRPPLGAL